VDCKKCKFAFEQKRPEDFVCYSCVPPPSPATICDQCKEGFQPEKDYYTTCRPCHEVVFKEMRARSAERRADRNRSQSRDRPKTGQTTDRNRSTDRSYSDKNRENRSGYQRTDRSYDRRDNRNDRSYDRRDNRDRRDDNRNGNRRDDTYSSDRRGRDFSRRNDQNRTEGQSRQRSESRQSSGSWKSYHKPSEHGTDVQTGPAKSQPNGNSSTFVKDDKQLQANVISGHLNGNEHIMFTDDLNNGNIREAVEKYNLNKEHSRLIAMATEVNSGHEGKALFDSGANLDTVTESFLEACKYNGAENFKIVKSDKKVRDFEGKECSTFGTVKMEITIGDALYGNKFTIIKGGYGCDIILGTPFLSTFGILTEMRDQIITLMRSKNSQ